MNDLFLERMKRELKEDYPAFERSLEQPMYKGLSYHPKKITKEMLKANTPLLEPGPFYAYGYYIDRSLGNHPYHIAFDQKNSSDSTVSSLKRHNCFISGMKTCQTFQRVRVSFIICIDQIIHSLGNLFPFAFFSFFLSVIFAGIGAFAYILAAAVSKTQVIFFD